MAVDSSIGGAASDTYNTVVEADGYFGADPNFATVWAALDTTTKESWLKFSTRALDRLEQFRGIRQSSSQSLEFPRILRSREYNRHRIYNLPGMYYDRYPFDEEEVIVANEIPRNVKRAQLELLTFLYNNKSDSSALDGKEIESLKVLNGLVDIKYSGIKDSRLESAGGGSITSVVSLLYQVIAPLQWYRG
jgi:hypothetical protein